MSTHDPDHPAARWKQAMEDHQACFWSDEWQEGERQATADIEAGRVIHFNTAEDFLKSLTDSDADS